MSKIREKLRDILERYGNFVDGYNADGDGLDMDETLEIILSINELAIVDREAIPPIRFLHPDDTPNASYRLAQEDIQKAGWVKEIK